MTEIVIPHRFHLIKITEKISSTEWKVTESEFFGSGPPIITLTYTTNLNPDEPMKYDDSDKRSQLQGLVQQIRPNRHGVI